MKQEARRGSEEARERLLAAGWEPEVRALGSSCGASLEDTVAGTHKRSWRSRFMSSWRKRRTRSKRSSEHRERQARGPSIRLLRPG